MAGSFNFGGLLGGVLSGLFGIGQQAMANSFAKKEAAKDRDFQSDEAEKNRDFQSDEAAAQRDWSAQENELNRLFNANEAALQRDWSAAEAEQARDWQEEMYAKYNSLSGKISQAEQAGVNPMFAIAGNAVTPMSASSPMPSGSAASGSVSGGASASGSAASGSRASAGLVNILGGILDGLKVKSEIELNESEAERNRADAEKTGKESSWIDKLSEAQLENMLMSTSKIQADVHVSEETANKLSAESNKLKAEGLRISKITDSEVRLTEANALLAEFESSVVKIINDNDSASTEDYVTAGAYLLSKIIGLGVQLSPKGIVRLN